ncbi:MAG: DNA sulfur modification protein DndB [Terracidiphilus sp.]|jgi:hypothetical protein
MGDIKGLLVQPKKAAGGRPYEGRFTLHDIRWSGEGREAIATFAVTAEQLADAAESNLLWTDQDVQRGWRPEINPRPARELPLAQGYPDTKLYVFDAANADDIAEKLLGGEKLFLGPLIWNLRPGEFEGYFDETSSSFHLYSGKIYLPDSHHRQQGILKAVRTFKEEPGAYPNFSLSKEFNIELYFLSKDDEGNYFYDKNQRPKPTAKSKAFDLTTLDDRSILAKKVIEKSTALTNNVNRVTDRLTARNPQVITLSTLREMMRDLTPEDSVDKAEVEGLAVVAAGFFDLLARVRPELGFVPVAERRKIRDRLIVDAAVMMHGYASLMKSFNESVSELNMRGATSKWQKDLQRLSSNQRYEFGKWSGDLFDKRNPLWLQIGVVKPGKTGQKLTVINTGGARSECGRVLRQLVATKSNVTNLEYLASR